MKKTSLLRLAAFAVIAGICLIFTVNFAYTLSSELIRKPIDTENMSDVLVDGSDFTPFFRLLGNTFNSFFLFVYMALNLAMIAVVSVLACTVFRIAAIRRLTSIGSAEMDAARNIYFGAAGTAIVVSLVITRFTYIIPVLLYIGIWWLNTTLICYLPIRDHYREDDAAAV